MSIDGRALAPTDLIRPLSVTANGTMSYAPYGSPHGQYRPQKHPPNQTSLALGIVSIVTGALAIFPGCCCILIWAPLALVSVGTGIGGILTADPLEPVGRILSIVGVCLGGVVLFLNLVYFALVAFDAIAPNQFQQLQNQF